MFAEVGVERGGHLVDERLGDCAQGETQVFQTLPCPAEMGGGGGGRGRVRRG